jgi:hypothetical protein
MTIVAMSAGTSRASASVATRIAGEHHGCFRSADPGRDLERSPELPGPGRRDRVVERNDEIRPQHSLEPGGHHRPGFQVVRERQGAEVAPERRPQPRRGSQHGGDPRLDRNREVAPAGLAVLHRLEYGRRHGEDAGVAAGDDRHPTAPGRELQSVAGAVDLDPVVAGMPDEAWTLGHAGDIGKVADQILRHVQGAAGGFGEQARVARAEADDRDASAQGRRPSPGSSTIEKYGASSSALSASRTTRSPAIVPRST